jgi:hypothetical protein
MSNNKNFMSGKTDSTESVILNKSPVLKNINLSTAVNTSTINPTNIDSNVNVHETNNIITNSQKSKFDKINLNTQFQPNILDNYDTSTYHFKLFIVTPESSSTGEIFNTDDQIIIAESGVSDLTIDKVEIEGWTTPTVDSGTGISTNIKFEIVEPAGAGLIDKIFYQSLALGIGNWNVMPFYLQLQFRARTPETSEATSNAPGSLNSLRWVWALKLSNISANVTNVGTRYEFTAIPYNELAQSNAYFTLRHTTVLNDLSTFADAMSKLTAKLNEDQIYRLIDNASIPDSYKIIIDPKIAEYLITPANNNINAVRSNNTVVLNGKDATFPIGTAIDKIIDSLLAQTNEYQMLMSNSSAPGMSGQTMNAEANQMKKFWRIITESRPLKFDPRQNNYAREYTIFVIQYDIGVLDVNTFQDSAGSTTLEAERKRLLTYINKSILKKKYNYIYTGLNDQIINFDIKINNAFASSVARMGGIYYEASMHDKGIVNQDNSANEASVTEKVQKAISFQNSAVSSSTVESQLAMNDARIAITSSELDNDTKSRYIKLLENSKPESRLNFLQNIQQNGGIDQDGELSRVKLNAKYLATPVIDKSSNTNLRFISDVNINDKSSQQAYNDFVKGIKGKLRPVARIDNMQMRQVGMGIESNSNSGIQKLSNIFSVALHSSFDVSFAKTSLTIKGDPFWLFPQPIINDKSKLFNSLKPVSEAIDWIKNGHYRVNDSVNIYGTDNFIIIRFRTPRIFNIDENPDTNNPFTDVEAFSGVFKVISVKSRFEAGKFQQELQCLMDYNINILNFIDEIESNSKNTDTPVSPDDLILKNTMPQDFNKFQRIKTDENSTGIQNRDISRFINRPLNSAELSNIPTPISNILSGLPNTFG